MITPRNVTRFRGTSCLNCEQPLDKSDKYCSNCGQVNSTKKLSFDDFFNEFFAGLFAYDSRVNRTINVILFRPGKISKDYIAGKRMRYANPFRFYLSASIIFFIIWSFSNSFEGIRADSPNEIENLSDQELEALKENLQRIPTVENSPINVDSLIDLQKRNRTRTYKDKYVSQAKLDSLGFLSSITEQFNLYSTFYKETDIIEPPVALDSLNHNISTYNKWFYKKIIDIRSIEKNPQVFISYFISKLPFIIFFYLPLFALFIWLLYVRRPFNYMEHLIFSFHVQTTFFIVMGISMLLNWIFGTEVFNGIFILLFLFYLYKAMRNFYCQKRFKTIVKFIFLNILFFILAVIAATISLIASFAIY